MTATRSRTYELIAWPGVAKDNTHVHHTCTTGLFQACFLIPRSQRSRDRGRRANSWLRSRLALRTLLGSAIAAVIASDCRALDHTRREGRPTGSPQRA